MNTKYIRIGLMMALVALFSVAATGTAHAGFLSNVGKVLGSTTSLFQKTKCLTGQVISVSYSSKTKKGAVAVKYAAGKKIVHKNFSLTKKQFDAAGKRSIRRGSQVKACFKGTSNALSGNLTNTAKKGTEQFAPSAENNGDGGGSGGGGGGGT